MTEYQVILLIGPQGSGKGTQAKFLQEKTGFFKFTMSDALREVSTDGSELGKQIVETINRGQLVSDEIVMDVFKKKMDTLSTEKGFILDAVTRSIYQAEKTIEYCESQGWKVATVFIDVPRDEIFSRLSLRAKSEGRVDDTPEKIEYRLQQYEKTTMPVLEYLKTKTDFFPINGAQSIEQVKQDIFKALGFIS